MNPTDTPSLSELVARLRESIASKETYNPERVKLMREAAEMLAVTDYGYREVCKKNDELQALVKLQTDTLSRLSGNGGGNEICTCNFEAAMGHPAFQHKRGEPGFGCKYEGAATPSASLEVTDAMIEAGIAAASNAPVDLVNCARCEGRGYHHGFGEDGVDPDWCSVCGGSGVDIEPDAEKKSMRHVLTAALTSSAAPQAQAAPPPNLEPQCGVGEHCRFCLTYPNPSSPATCKTMQEASKCPWHSQAASAAVPKPIDDGAVEREPWLTLKAIAEFPVADPNNISAINMAQMAKRGLDHLRRAALQVSQTK